MLDKLNSVVISDDQLAAMRDGIADAVWTLREVLNQSRKCLARGLAGMVEQKIAKLERILTP